MTVTCIGNSHPTKLLLASSIRAWGPFLESPETFRAHFGWHNSLCIFKTKASRGTKLCSHFNFYSLHNIRKDQLHRISKSEFYEWLFAPEKFSGLSRNGPQVNSSWCNRKQLWLPLVDMLQVLEFRMVTHAARERVTFTAFTFTTPLFSCSFQFAPSELNRSLYDVTHWSNEGLPCVAILFTTLSFPRSICKYCPIAFEPDDQEPLLPLFWILLRRACHGSYPVYAQDEHAFTASFVISLFSIPRGWMRHSVSGKTNSFLFKFTCGKLFQLSLQKALRFYGPKKLGVDLYRMQIAWSSWWGRYINRLNC